MLKAPFTLKQGTSNVSSLTQGTDDHGNAGFAFDTATGTGSGAITLTETQQGSFTLHQQNGRNAVCADKSGNQVPVTNSSDSGFKRTVAADNSYNCVVQNVKKPEAEVAIDKGLRPGAAVQLKPDGSGELVYKMMVKNLDAANKATTKPIMDVVRVPAEVRVTGPVTVTTTNTGASATGAVSSIPASSFVAGQTVKLADSLSIDPGKQFVFELRVPIKVDPKLDQAKKKSAFSRIGVPVLLVLVGLAVLLYPVVATQWNNHKQQQVAEEYSKFEQHADPAVLAESLEEALLYNETRNTGPILDPWLARISNDNLAYQDYLSHLDDYDAMARIVVPDAHIDLPVYHGTDEQVLQKGVGHLFGSD